MGADGKDEEERQRRLSRYAGALESALGNPDFVREPTLRAYVDELRRMAEADESDAHGDEAPA
ncbi:MAG: hypothetical protein M1158_02665 [Candidatus Marsarchaeota archaeon]|nr:hypothetical protein [Candidatus Marsarchaeota archaeon]